MKNWSVQSLFIGIALGSAITFGATNLDLNEKLTQDGMTMSMNDMNHSLKAQQINDFDLEFLRLMIDHHQGAVEMAREAQERAQHQEIKDLSQVIIETQTQEINQMKSWADEWSKKK